MAARLGAPDRQGGRMTFLPADLMQTLQKAKQWPIRWREKADALRQERLVGQAGAGLVRVEVNGLGEVIKVHIDPIVWQKADREMVETLLPAAINDARQKARTRLAQAWDEVAQDLALPLGQGLFELLFPLV